MLVENPKHCQAVDLFIQRSRSVHLKRRDVYRWFESNRLRFARVSTVMWFSLDDRLTMSRYFRLGPKGNHAG